MESAYSHWPPRPRKNSVEPTLVYSKQPGTPKAAVDNGKAPKLETALLNPGAMIAASTGNPTTRTPNVDPTLGVSDGTNSVTAPVPAQPAPRRT